MSDISDKYIDKITMKKHKGSGCLTKYEKLLNKAEENNVTIYESYDLSDTRLQGLYCDGSIALSNELETEAEKFSILNEEMGHHFTSSGDIINMSILSNRKQELKARLWGYNNAIGLSGIISAYKHGCRNREEMADFFGVSEQYLCEALEAYTAKYSPFTQVDNYIIYFVPALGVLEIQE